MKKFFLQIFALLIAFKTFGQGTWTTTCGANSPQLLEIVVDACGVEGETEFFVFKTGNTAYNPSTLTAEGSSGNNPTATNFSGINALSIVNQLNTWASCGTNPFQAAPNPIPANATVIAFVSSAGLASISPVPDLSTYCGQTIYVIAGNYNSAAGFYVNGGGSTGTKTAKVTFNTGCTTTTTYIVGSGGPGIPFPTGNGANLTEGTGGVSNYNNPGDCFPPIPCVNTPVTVTPTASVCYSYSLNLNILLTAPNPLPSGQWSGVGVSGNIFDSMGLAAGDYDVTFTPDPGSCYTAASSKITVTAPIDRTPTQTGKLCSDANGNSTGMVTLSVPAGNFNYEWSQGTTGAANNSIDVTQAGIYNVTVTDKKGCVDYQSFNVSAQPLPLVTINAPSEICKSVPTVLSLNNDFDKILWSDGAVTKTTTITQPGIYSVTVTDAIGCSNSTDVTIAEATPLAVNILGNTKICSGDSTELKVDGTYKIYLWSNGTLNQSIYANKAGNYSVIVTANSGCTGTASVNVSEVKVLTPKITGSLIICSGKNTVLDAGAGYADYLWSDGSKTRTTTISKEGIYSVTVADAMGCKKDTSVEVTSKQISSIYQDTLCATDFKIINGNRYDITKSAGVETLLGASASGCDSTVTIQLFFRNNIKVNLLGATTICKPTPIDLTLDVENFTGTFDIIYEDNMGVKTPVLGVKDGDKFTVNPTGAATYKIIFTNIQNGGCSVELGEAKISFGNLTLTKKADDITCFGEKNGSASVSATSGVPPFSYIWSNGATTIDLRDLSAGKYITTVTDASGCVAIDSIEIKEPKPLTLDLKSEAVYCKATTGTITLFDIGGGNGNYTYAIDNQSFEQVGALPYKILNIAPGLHKIVINDSKKCTINDTISVAPANAIKVSLGPDITINYGDSVVITPVTAFQMTKIQWSPKTNLTCDSVCQFPIAKPKATTNYRVTVWDANGCTATDDIFIFVTKNRRVYIPNAFSPDDNQHNDLLRVYLGDETEKVVSFRIFDRWGTLIYEDLDFTRAESYDSKRGWDGTYNGFELSPAVFTYHAKILFSDGETKDYVGNVMLVR